MADRKAGNDEVVMEPGELSETTGTESESGPRLQENGEPKKKYIYRLRYKRQQPYWVKSPKKTLDNLVPIPEDPELEEALLKLDEEADNIVQFTEDEALEQSNCELDQ